MNGINQLVVDSFVDAQRVLQLLHSVFFSSFLPVVLSMIVLYSLPFSMLSSVHPVVIVLRLVSFPSVRSVQPYSLFHSPTRTDCVYIIYPNLSHLLNAPSSFATSRRICLTLSDISFTLPISCRNCSSFLCIPPSIVSPSPPPVRCYLTSLLFGDG